MLKTRMMRKLVFKVKIIVKQILESEYPTVLFFSWEGESIGMKCYN